MTRPAPIIGILLSAALMGCGGNEPTSAPDDTVALDPGDGKADSTATTRPRGSGSVAPSRPDTPEPRGCTKRQDGSTVTTHCVVDKTVNGVPLHWEVNRLEYKAAPSPASPTGAAPTGVPRIYAAETTTTIKSGAQMILQLQQRVGSSATGAASGDQMSYFTYGPLVRGITSASFVTTSGQISGSVNGRSIAPLSTDSAAAGTLRFADGTAVPTAAMDARIRSALQTLLRQPTFKVTAFDVAEANAGDECDQNTPFDWRTPHCQKCEKDCAEDWTNWIGPPALLWCEARCFVPGHGCMEKNCGLASSCDNDMTCCGDICCNKDEVCGNDKYGSCCPKDLPVACGDQTQMLCYPAGTTCCDGSSTGVCGPGSQCTRAAPGAAPGCCANDKACDGTCCGGSDTCMHGPGGPGVCCDHPLCGNECCTNGEVCNPTTGHCGFGSVCGSQLCGFGQSCCHDSCCNGSCTVNGACCPTGQVTCGNACCGAGQSCTNGVCTTPALPTLILYSPASGTIIGESASAGFPGYDYAHPLNVTNSQSIRVTGRTFLAGGWVSLRAHGFDGPEITTVYSTDGTFSVNITTSPPFAIGRDKLVAMGDGLQVANVYLNVTSLR